MRLVTAGDACPQCASQIQVYRGIEAGHIFVLGTHYSEKMKAVYRDTDGDEKPLVMGCYGIGISRLMAAIVEQHHDESGLRWPHSGAPYLVHICQLGQSAEVQAAVVQLESEFLNAGIEPFVDDRDERPGIKFKDADLIGVPYRLTVGDRGLKQGNVELRQRSEQDPKASEALSLQDAAAQVIARIQDNN